MCVPQVPTTTPSAMKDRKSTRLNSSHEWISYAVFCLKKKTGYIKGCARTYFFEGTSLLACSSMCWPNDLAMTSAAHEARVTETARSQESRLLAEDLTD